MDNLYIFNRCLVKTSLGDLILKEAFRLPAPFPLNCGEKLRSSVTFHTNLTSITKTILVYGTM